MAKFVKYLPSFEWQPYVITVKDIAYYAKDASLLTDVQGAKVFRTGSLDPQRLLAILFDKKERERNNKESAAKRWITLHKFFTWFFIPDSKKLWVPFATMKALKIVRKERIDCLLTTSPPHSIHLAGKLIQAWTKLPWVVDFRDDWSRGNFQSEPTPLHKWVNARLENWVIKSANRIVGVSHGLVEKMCEKVSGDPSRFTAITNGFDDDDFQAFQPGLRNQKFTMTYCGTLSSIAPVSGFLKGLSGLIRRKPDLKANVTVKFVGLNLAAEIEREIFKLGLDDIVQWTGYAPHREALQHIMQADLLLYPIADWASRDFIPGKTFEYLASGKPVLAIGPSVEGVEILQETTAVELVGHHDLQAIETAIFKQYSMFEKGRGISVLGQSGKSQYERRELTKRLAEVLDRTVES